MDLGAPTAYRISYYAHHLFTTLPSLFSPTHLSFLPFYNFPALRALLLSFTLFIKPKK